MHQNFREPRSSLAGAAHARSFSGSRSGASALQDGRRGAPLIAASRLSGTKLGSSSAVRAAGQALGADVRSQTVGTQLRKARPGVQRHSGDFFSCEEPPRRQVSGSDAPPASSYDSRALHNFPHDIESAARNRARSSSGSSAGPLWGLGSGGSGHDAQATDSRRHPGGVSLGPAAVGSRTFSAGVAGPELPKVVMRPGVQEKDAEGSDRSNPKRLEKRFSCRSESTIGKLSDFEMKFNEIDASITRIAEAFHTGEFTPGRARDDLAQLEACLDKLQFNGVDCIDTYELESGKEQARSLRKELTRRAEELHERMEVIFKEIKDVMLAGTK